MVNQAREKRLVEEAAAAAAAAQNPSFSVNQNTQLLNQDPEEEQKYPEQPVNSYVPPKPIEPPKVNPAAPAEPQRAQNPASLARAEMIKQRIKENLLK